MVELMEMITANRNSLQAKDDQRRREAKVSHPRQAVMHCEHTNLLTDKQSYADILTLQQGISPDKQWYSRTSVQTSSHTAGHQSREAVIQQGVSADQQWYSRASVQTGSYIVGTFWPLKGCLWLVHNHSPFFIKTACTLFTTYGPVGVLHARHDFWYNLPVCVIQFARCLDYWQNGIILVSHARCLRLLR